MQTAARKVTAEVLQPTEHAFDGVSVAVEERREAVLPFAIGFRRDVRHCASIRNLLPNGVRIVALVAVQNVAMRKLFEQLGAGCAIGDLSTREHECDRTALAVGQRMDFRRAPAARSADGLVRLPPFPPAAERCALTAELSIRTCAGGPPA